jgi:hypothetical protein
MSTRAGSLQRGVWPGGAGATGAAQVARGLGLWGKVCIQEISEAPYFGIKEGSHRWLKVMLLFDDICCVRYLFELMLDGIN